MQAKLKVLLYAGAGYAAAVLTSPFLPELLSLLLPVAGAAYGLVEASLKRPRTNLPAEVLPAGPAQETVPAPPPLPEQKAGSNSGAANTAASPSPAAVLNGAAAPQIGPEFAPVVEYLSILEDMIISEGQKDTLDNEIVEKSLALFARLQRVIPLLQELNNGEINHTVRRLILKDLNGVINPFLRLGGEAKTRNRRMLLNGLRDVDAKISDIASTIEHKDLMELQTKAELIHQRYSSSEL
ncbi:hypothetical protein [Paenibacillus donghaensis]|uniref:Uncharacterized protein n=1 Tax=Paenibacillus donghaensis TaxID=414771 RepID=A0A2Z2KKM1_9BACL|nr:hypothetical protein [Paenibacillus donghaensis]ASA26587.1 hypothetical protein B9T62_33860 [Paenibacillus donghaensis]